MLGEKDPMRSFLNLAGVAALLVASAAGADTAVIVADRDNTLYEDEVGAVSNGAGEHFFAGTNNQGRIRRGVVHFDVSAIPPGSTIDSAVLTLNMSQTIAGPSAVSLHRATADWGEGASQAAGQEGAGGPAEAGDATWIHTFFDGLFWTNPGGDFDAGASATTIVNQEGPYSWGSTAGMIADVEAWVADASQNFGWVVIGEEPLGGKQEPSAKRFDSREIGSDGLQFPELVIGFTPPVPVVLQSFDVE
jgi:hypothetical protein